MFLSFQAKYSTFAIAAGVFSSFLLFPLYCATILQCSIMKLLANPVCGYDQGTSPPLPPQQPPTAATVAPPPRLLLLGIQTFEGSTPLQLTPLTDWGDKLDTVMNRRALVIFILAVSSQHVLAKNTAIKFISGPEVVTDLGGCV